MENLWADIVTRLGIAIFALMKMKCLAACAAALLVGVSCCDKADTSSVRSGDLVFVRIPSGYDLGTDSMSEAITSSTSQSDTSNMTVHVAILEVGRDSVWIIDATIRHGVDRYPLGTFLADFTLKDGSLPELVIKRPRVTARAARQFVENAKGYIGQPYDVHFLPDNGAMYCSELVYHSYVTPDGSHIFHEYPMNFKSPDGTMPQYWTQLFALLGQEVPQGVPGTNPEAMSAEDVFCSADLDGNALLPKLR